MSFGNVGNWLVHSAIALIAAATPSTGHSFDWHEVRHLTVNVRPTAELFFDVEFEGHIYHGESGPKSDSCRNFASGGTIVLCDANRATAAVTGRSGGTTLGLRNILKRPKNLFYFSPQAHDSPQGVISPNSEFSYRNLTVHVGYADSRTKWPCLDQRAWTVLPSATSAYFCYDGTPVLVRVTGSSIVEIGLDSDFASWLSTSALPVLSPSR